VADRLFVILIVNVAMTSIVMLVMTVSLQFGITVCPCQSIAAYVRLDQNWYPKPSA